MLVRELARVAGREVGIPVVFGEIGAEEQSGYRNDAERAVPARVVLARDVGLNDAHAGKENRVREVIADIRGESIRVFTADFHLCCPDVDITRARDVRRLPDRHTVRGHWLEEEST